MKNIQPPLKRYSHHQLKQALVVMATYFLNKASSYLIQVIWLVEALRADRIDATVLSWLMEVFTCREATGILHAKRMFYHGPLPPSRSTLFPGSLCFRSRQGIRALLKLVSVKQLVTKV